MVKAAPLVPLPGSSVNASQLDGLGFIPGLGFRVDSMERYERRAGCQQLLYGNSKHVPQSICLDLSSVPLHETSHDVPGSIAGADGQEASECHFAYGLHPKLFSDTYMYLSIHVRFCMSVITSSLVAKVLLLPKKNCQQN